MTDNERDLIRELGELREQVSAIWSHNVWADADEQKEQNPEVLDRIKEIEEMLGIERVEPRKCRRPCRYSPR